MPTTTFDDQHLIVARAQKVAALLALAYHHNIPVPANPVPGITGDPRFMDFEFAASLTEFMAWKRWLGGVECRDFPGSGLRVATATAELDTWGPVTVRFTVARDAD